MEPFSSRSAPLLSTCTSRHPCLQTRVGGWRHVGAGVPFPKRAARCVYQGGLPSAPSQAPRSPPAPREAPKPADVGRHWRQVGGIPFPSRAHGTCARGDPAPVQYPGSTQTHHKGHSMRPLPQLLGAPQHSKYIFQCGCALGGRAAGGPSSSRRGLPLRRRRGRSPRAGRDFPYASPSPLETLDRPDLLFQLLAPCLGAGGSPQACLINRLYSAKAVNLSRPLRFALFNVFSCL